MRQLAPQVVVSCEHASNRLPAGVDLDPRLRELHIAWDPGALHLARHLSRQFDAPLHQGRYSRLLVDLNRSPGNRMLIRRVSDGHRIPFNSGLTARDREDRLERYYRPYRDAVSGSVREAIVREGRCVHLCVHTYTPALAGNVRGNDIGLLHDPAWGIERQVCAEIRASVVAETAHVVWFNRPYSGTADGILPALRRENSPEAYVGIEIEVNQKFAGDTRALNGIAASLGRALSNSRGLRE